MTTGLLCLRTSRIVPDYSEPGRGILQLVQVWYGCESVVAACTRFALALCLPHFTLGSPPLYRLNLSHPCVPAGVVQRYAGGSGQLQSPPPGRCGQSYATQVQGLYRAGLCPGRSGSGGIGPLWCRPACAMQRCNGSSHIAQARQRWPSLRVAVHRLSFRAFSLYIFATLLWHAVCRNSHYRPLGDDHRSFL